ncbi:MAG: M16 family metallopeptidase, partial [Fidelibacterota bacterium]
NVIMMPIDKMPVVSIKCLIKSGTSSDKKGKSGCTSLLMELLKKGSGNKNARQFSEAIDFLGGSINTGSTPDYSLISAEFLQKDLTSALGFIGDIVMNPHLPEKEFWIAQRRISAAIQGIRDNPSSLNSYYFQKLFYGEKHPYGSPKNGILPELNALKPEDISDFYNHHFVANNITLIITGRFEIDKAFDTIQKLFSPLKSGTENKVDRSLLNSLKQNHYYILDNPDAVQTYIRMGVPGIYQNHSASIPLIAANSLFGGSFTSRLNQEIRANCGLTYSISSGFTRMFHQGSFTIATFTKTESTVEMLTAIFQELDRIHREPPTDNELQDTIRYLQGTYPMSLETADQLSQKLTHMVLYRLRPTWISDYLTNLQKLTATGLCKTIERYFPVSGYTCVLVGNAAEVESRIRGMGEITILPSDSIQL